MFERVRVGEDLQRRQRCDTFLQARLWLAAEQAAPPAAAGSLSLSAAPAAPCDCSAGLAPAHPFALTSPLSHHFLQFFEHEGCRMVEMTCEEHDQVGRLHAGCLQR